MGNGRRGVKFAHRKGNGSVDGRRASFSEHSEASQEGSPKAKSSPHMDQIAEVCYCLLDSRVMAPGRVAFFPSPRVHPSVQTLTILLNCRKTPLHHRRTSTKRRSRTS